MRKLLAGVMLLAAAALVMASANVGAQGEKKDPGKNFAEKLFKKVDANSDGKVSKAELMSWVDTGNPDPEKAAKIRAVYGKAYDATAGASDGLTLPQFIQMFESLRKK